MKVAFCFSGQIRDIEKNKFFWLKQILKYDADVYASFWDIENEEKGDTIANFVESFKPIKIGFDKISAFEATYLKYIKEHIRTPYPLEPHLSEKCLNGSLFGMWYKIWKANLLRESSGIEYDIIVRCRTDMFFDGDIDFEINHYLNVPIGSTKGSAPVESYGCNDMFAYGNKDVMNYYCNLYNNLYAYLREGHYLSPAENMLRVHLMNSNIAIKEIPKHIFLTYDWCLPKDAINVDREVKFNGFADLNDPKKYRFDGVITLDPNYSYYKPKVVEQKIKIEVGANLGNDTEHLASDGSIVYAFEPTHELLKHLWEKFKTNSNVKILPFAVDKENGFANFKIAGHHDWGCSSLYDFSGEWEREDFYVNDSYEVPKITLFDFCNMYNVRKIDYLWVDAQGNDYNCLLSLGDKINIVKAGQCEVALSKKLYSDNENTIEVVKPWLESHGFTVTVNPDPIGAEANLMFERN